jgi:hypothetical protein
MDQETSSLRRLLGPPCGMVIRRVRSGPAGGEVATDGRRGC